MGRSFAGCAAGDGYDAQRARDLGIDSGRIGVLGFSAGGIWSRHSAPTSRKRTYEPVDEADAISCRT